MVLKCNYYHYELLNMKTQIDNIYKTPDLAESAYLLVSGFPFISMQKDADGRAFFIFKDSPELQKAVIEFISDTARVAPRRFYYCWRDLRGKI